MIHDTGYAPRDPEPGDMDPRGRVLRLWDEAGGGFGAVIFFIGSVFIIAVSYLP